VFTFLCSSSYLIYPFSYLSLFTLFITFIFPLSYYLFFFFCISTRFYPSFLLEDPDVWAPAYAEAGAESVTFHLEAAKAPVRLARELRAKGARVGMALKPATPIEPYAELLAEIDMILIMTVEPGFGGQKFLDLTLPKITRARELITRNGGDIWLQVDGGVSAETIERSASAGADAFVAGSAGGADGASSRQLAGR